LQHLEVDGVWQNNLRIFLLLSSGSGCILSVILATGLDKSLITEILQVASLESTCSFQFQAFKCFSENISGSGEWKWNFLRYNGRVIFREGPPRFNVELLKSRFCPGACPLHLHENYCRTFGLKKMPVFIGLQYTYRHSSTNSSVHSSEFEWFELIRLSPHFACEREHRTLPVGVYHE